LKGLIRAIVNFDREWLGVVSAQTSIGH